MQLSAFFPFYRNHNRLAANAQEPYLWSSVIKASQDAMSISYALLPYFYTLLYQAHTTDSTVMRALAWEYPNDPSLASVETQFLLGPALMVVPVLQPRATTVNRVFPGLDDGEKWYDWYTQTVVDYAQPGVNTTIDAPLGHIPVFIRGGNVIPMQQPALTTREARNTPWSLIVALDEDGNASGSLYMDDGESISPNATLSVDFSASKSKLTAASSGTWRESNAYEKVIILGVKHAPKDVRFNGDKINQPAQYNSTSHVLTIADLQDKTGQGAWHDDWVLEW